jgi:hypothetical protein
LGLDFPLKKDKNSDTAERELSNFVKIILKKLLRCRVPKPRYGRNCISLTVSVKAHYWAERCQDYRKRLGEFQLLRFADNGEEKVKIFELLEKNTER